ncbi:mismatch repair endonuclease PMS2 [Planococcus citri]|uniref:mismatch repair endonuclease PMS2 n=1 Tax=Planococcus citri TaxID=170843 RepID=UPI0031F831A5
MSAEIKAIQRNIVHRICSGQVVLNLATAIKELVENSLDAGATIIDVRLKEYGSELIEVVDNGTGIHPNNFQALTLKHHTSKLNDFSDLVNVETFGFRGEALSSLCAVSDVMVTTRHESEKHGSKLIFDNLGALQSSEPCARQVGTTISLGNIFSSLPVRQKEFHRNLKKEFHKAVQILSAYCLISANVKITCVNRTKKGGNQTFLSTQENKTIRDNISCVFGSKQLSTLLEMVNKTPSEEILSEFSVKSGSDDSDSFTLHGYISSCEHGVGRSSADRQFYYINGRPCEPSKVIKLVNEVYHQYNQHQFPFVLMNIVVSKHMVDVNVTPDKRLLFLQNENRLFACVKSTLIGLFENIPSSYKMNNPLCGLPPSNVAARERPTFALSTLDKWRHANDKGGDANERKRSNDESERKIVCKQMKLDFGEKSRTSGNPDVNIEPTRADSSTITRSFNQVPEAETRVARESCRDSLNLNAAQEPRSIKHVADRAVVLEMTENVAAITSAELSFSGNNSENEILDDELPSAELSQSGSTENETPDDELRSTEDDSNISINCENDQVPDSCRSVENESISASVDVECDQQRIIEQRNTRGKSVSLRTSLHDIRRFLKQSAINRNRNRNDEISNRFHAEIDPNKNKLAEEELSKAISKEMFSEMKIIGQFNKGFIITKLENDLFIIDQHATDEKYNFETLQRTTSLNCQKLVIPQDLDLTVTNECLLIDNIEVFRKNGFEFLIDSTAEATKRVKLVSIPMSQNWKFGKEDIDEMLFMLQDAPHSTCRPSRIRAMFASRACRKSVMIGTPLSGTDMKRLVAHMSEIEHPWNCPHGRPTMRHLINLSLLG